MKKLIAFLLAAMLLLALCACGAKEPLTMKKDTWYVSPAGNAMGVAGAVDLEASEISAEDITAKSSDESFVKIEDGKIVVAGGKMGEADVTLTAGAKEGTLHVCVVDYPEYLEKNAEQAKQKDAANRDVFDKNDINTWNLYCWLTAGLDTFKNPASVQITGSDVFYAKTDGDEYPYFLIELRAENSFGGYGVSYFKVSSSGVEQVNWQPTLISPNYNGDTVMRGFSAMYLSEALTVYIDRNYK